MNDQSQGGVLEAAELIAIGWKFRGPGAPPAAAFKMEPSVGEGPALSGGV